MKGVRSGTARAVGPRALRIQGTLRLVYRVDHRRHVIDIVRIGTKYEVRLPREMVLVAKQMLYFERYAKLMAPDWNILNDPDLIGFLFEGLESHAVGEDLEERR